MIFDVNISDMKIENLRAFVFGKKLNIYQKGDAVKEFLALEQENKELRELAKLGKEYQRAVQKTKDGQI